MTFYDRGEKKCEPLKIFTRFCSRYELIYFKIFQQNIYELLLLRVKPLLRAYSQPSNHPTTPLNQTNWEKLSRPRP